MFQSGIPLAARRGALVLATLAAAMVTGLAFAGWMGQGGDMFLALLQSGLAMCF